jgi:hypothetical protein
MKSVNTYQQTFWGRGATSWSFQFTRIYKSRPENKLVVRAIQSIAGVSADGVDKPIIISLTNGADITGKCNQYVNAAGTASATTNPFVLGIIGSANRPPTMTNSPMMIVNDLPLNQMTISVRHYDDTATGNLNCFVVFEIEEIEE